VSRWRTSNEALPDHPVFAFRRRKDHHCPHAARNEAGCRLLGVVHDQKARDFAESAEVHGHLYGTLRAEVERVLSSGKHVIMDIDVQGTKQFARAFPDSVLVFILPPSAQVLVDRLKARGTEDTKSLIRRFKSAKAELKAIDLYQYVIVNAEIDSAVAAVSRIIDAEELKRSRNESLDARVKDLMDGIQHAIDQYSARK